MVKKKKTVKAKKKAVKKSAAKRRRPPAARHGTVRRTAGRRAVKTPAKTPKPIGEVTHFYTEIGVAIVKFKQNVPTGAALYFKGATTDFREVAKSMQYEHEMVAVAKKGKLIGIKVKKRVRPGDKVHFAE